MAVGRLGGRTGKPHPIPCLRSAFNPPHPHPPAFPLLKFCELIWMAGARETFTHCGFSVRMSRATKSAVQFLFTLEWTSRLDLVAPFIILFTIHTLQSLKVEHWGVQHRTHRRPLVVCMGDNRRKENRENTSPWSMPASGDTHHWHPHTPHPKLMMSACRWTDYQALSLVTPSESNSETECCQVDITLIMGARAAKLSAEEIKDLQQCTYCEYSLLNLITWQ